MSRPVDWSPLELDRDPVPGDPTQVEVSGKHYREVATAIETAARRLRELATHEQMQSDAVEALRERAEDVAKDIERAHRRYQGVGDALVAFVAPLETAQATSVRALGQAQDAVDRIGPARQRGQSSKGAVESAPEGTDTTELESASRAADAALAEAEEDLAAAKRLCADAVADRDEAAAAAIRAIQEVEDSGDLNDSWWDNWGAKIVSVIAEVAFIVAMVARLLALCVGWIPIIGQALAAVLGTIALIATAVSLVCNIALAATGYGSWDNAPRRHQPRDLRHRPRGGDRCAGLAGGDARLFEAGGRAGRGELAGCPDRGRPARWVEPDGHPGDDRQRRHRQPLADAGTQPGAAGGPDTGRLPHRTVHRRRDGDQAVAQSGQVDLLHARGAGLERDPQCRAEHPQQPLGDRGAGPALPQRRHPGRRERPGRAPPGHRGRGRGHTARRSRGRAHRHRGRRAGRLDLRRHLSERGLRLGQVGPQRPEPADGLQLPRDPGVR